MFATGQLGAVFVPLNWRLAPPELAYQLSDCGVRLVIVAPSCAGLVRELLAFLAGTADAARP